MFNSPTSHFADPFADYLRRPLHEAWIMTFARRKSALGILGSLELKNFELQTSKAQIDVQFLT